MADMEPVVEQPYKADDTAVTPWTEASERLKDAGTYWLATVRPDGLPHAVPLLAVWVDGALHFVANKTSRKARNIAHDSHCVITTHSGGVDLVLEGEAAKVRDDGKLERVAAVYASKYGWNPSVRDGALWEDGAPTAGPPPYDVYEVSITTAFGFGDDSFSPTRWRF